VAQDARGRALPARMAPGAGLDGGALSLLVDDAQAVYPLTIDPVLTLQQKITANDGAASDFFGLSVALSGDTAVVGAPFDDVTALDQGSVYVFVRNGTGWSQQKKLTVLNPLVGDRFGTSVAISGDTVVAGALNNLGKGAAYAFVRSGADWTQQQKFTADD